MISSVMMEDEGKKEGEEKLYDAMNEPVSRSLWRNFSSSESTRSYHLSLHLEILC